MHALTRIYFKGGGGGSSFCLILNFSIIAWSFFHMSVKTMKQCIYLSIGYRTLEMILSYLSNTRLSIKNVRLSEVLLKEKMYGWLIESHVILKSLSHF